MLLWARAVVALAMIAVPWECPTATAPPPSPSSAQDTTVKAPETKPRRVTTAPPPGPPRKAIELPEAVIVRALDVVGPSFARCFVRARNADPLLGKLKVLLHLDVDDGGAVIAALADEPTRKATPKLATCLAIVARSMKFPAPGQPAVVDVPLLD